MGVNSQYEIIDITLNDEYDIYLHRCLGGPFRKYRKRAEYLQEAIPKGFHKKLLIFNQEIVGTIEYSPAEVSYYPIMGDNLIVMNCIWVLRKAKGHHFGRLLIEDMIASESGTSGFATIALENHWSPWFVKSQFEGLGFSALDSVKVSHKVKYKDRIFSLFLMWMPNIEKAAPPKWDKAKLLEGITSCIAHPLYHPQPYEAKQILEFHS